MADSDVAVKVQVAVETVPAPADILPAEIEFLTEQLRMAKRTAADSGHGVELRVALERRGPTKVIRVVYAGIHSKASLEPLRTQYEHHEKALKEFREIRR